MIFSWNKNIQSEVLSFEIFSMGQFMNGMITISDVFWMNVRTSPLTFHFKRYNWPKQYVFPFLANGFLWRQHQKKFFLHTRRPVYSTKLPIRESQPIHNVENPSKMLFLSSDGEIGTRILFMKFVSESNEPESVEMCSVRNRNKRNTHEIKGPKIQIENKTIRV